MQLTKDSYVTYGSNGLCRVEGTEDRRFADKSRQYYVLIPCSTKGSTIFVPTDNPALVAKIKPLLSQEEIREMIRRLPEEQLPWIEDPSARKDRFREILEQGDRLEQMRLLATLYRQKKHREAEGKKLWAFEENALDATRNILFEEFAHVLGIPKEEVEALILSQFQ